MGTLLPSFVVAKSRLVKHPVAKTYGAGAGCILCVGSILLTMQVVKTGNIALSCVSLGVLGICMCFSEPIISGMLPIEIADVDGRKLHGSVSGFVNGTGSLEGL